MVENLHARQGIRVHFLGWEGPPEQSMAAHTSTVAQRIPWTEEPGGPQSMGPHRVGHDRSDEAAAPRRKLPLSSLEQL